MTGVEASPVDNPDRTGLRRRVLTLAPWLLCLALAATVLILVDPFAKASDGADTASQPRNVLVKFVLYSGETYLNGCVGDAGYSDIGPGVPVTLRNGEGDILAAGSLGVGVGQKGSPKATCTFTAKLADVSPNESFYSVEVGRRGEITQSLAELEANDFTFGVSLGL